MSHGWQLKRGRLFANRSVIVRSEYLPRPSSYRAWNFEITCFIILETVAPCKTIRG